MGRPLYTNNAASALAAGITSTQTTIQVQDGMGSLFPTPVGGDYFYVTLTSISIGGAFEIMQCTARSGDTMTVIRGVEGTSAQSFNVGDNVQLRITAAGMNFLTGQAVTSTEEEAQTATQGQTVFTLVNFDYSPGTNNLAVFVNGSKQVSGVNYSETSVNTVTFNTGLNVGDIVEFLVGISVASGTLFANDVQYNEGGTGAVTRTVQTKLQESVSVMDFGARGDGTNDDTSAIQAAINSLGATGGLVYFPTGIYICSAPIVMAKYITLKGDGPISSVLKWATTGNGITMTSPINSSTAVFTGVYDLGLTCTNGSNTGGGYVDVGGTFVNIQNVSFLGFKYGVIFDQTELAEINLCYFQLQLLGGVWLVNGPDHTIGASALFTNRISIQKCQFNQGTSAYGIIDDGGYSHNFDTNNYNGCLTHIRAAGVTPLNISNSELESAASTPIVLTSTALSGTGVGQSTNTCIQNNIIAPTTGQSCINALSVGNLVCIDNFFGNSSAQKVIGGTGIASFIDIGNSNGGGGVTFGGGSTWQFSTNNYGTFTPTLAFGGGTTGITYSTQTGNYTRVGNLVTINITITLTSKGSSTGVLSIQGLPFQSTAGGSILPPPFITGVVGAGITNIAPIVSVSSTQILLQNAFVNYSSALTDANISNTSTIVIQGSYFAN